MMGTGATLRLGYIDLSFHAASASVVQAILERHGHEVELSAAPHEAMFQRLQAGEVDIVASAWLPTSHGEYLAPLQKKVEKLAVLYEPYCIWGVPDYIPQDVLASVEDLKKPEVLANIDKFIDGINAGAGISRFSSAMIDAYGLDRYGYRFYAGSEASSFTKFKRAVANKRWLVIPLWHPQYLHHDYRIRALEEPKGLLGGTDQATLVARKGVLPKIAPSALAELRILHLGNAVLTDLEHATQVEGITPLQAATRWLATRSEPVPAAVGLRG
ncbi:glycine betaine ABC transporter substrate-binding protein [Massilia phyllosphaerae]|uniref:glycine betaine ABC transporter substrate-binding protein n=1 Tax=Massilia phyllosphaerae TaxID=3106034 RepID=UPI002B1CC09D|nr:glycine betaine ABC transporter substrate-binding protein [Massilia sp. SGZ-792]